MLASAVEIPYEQTADGISQQKRLIEHVRTLYRRHDLTALLPLGVVEPLALPGESYKLALTPSLLAHVFKRKQAGQPDKDLLPNAAPLLEGKGDDQGGYIAMDGNWWIPSGRAFFDPGANAANPALTAALELNTARQHFYLPRKVADPFGHSTEVDYAGHDLLVARTSDALGNTVTAANDYRVLQPRLVTDPNRNRTAAAFDALGMVVATAVMGKESENLGDLLEDFEADPPLANLQAFVADPQAQAASLLGKATTRIVYDLERYQRAGQPPFAATLARETHFHDPGGAQTKIQISFSYSDGFGREIQKKIQAEAGDAPQCQAPVPLPTGDIRPGDLVRDAQGELVQANTPRRWVGSGRTVFNNKGKPVRQYEPFFSATHLYEPEREMTDTGVSPVLFYDPVERVVATLHPNHTYEKVVFDPWQQTTYDVNDTVAASGTQTGDPRTDPDITGYVREYFKTQPATWQTWHTQRSNGQLGAEEQAAATRTTAHADTPTVAHFDTLGRTFLTLAHNGFKPDGTPIQFPTRVELDIEGNQRAVIDAKDRIVMRYDYDLLGNRIHQASMDASERWMLNDAAGNPIRAWDSRRFLRRMTYDTLRRPISLYVTEDGTERLVERTVYGESLGDDAKTITLNLRTRVYQQYDLAGIVTNVAVNPNTGKEQAYDFKGNLLVSKRDLLPTYKQAVDWLQNPTANDGSFTSRTTYDALNRPLTATSPDGSVYRPTFNEANLLDKVDVNLRGAAAATPFVTNINYNAKGQRTRIDYATKDGKLISTSYTYDRETFRLTHLYTRRGVDPVTRQGVTFTDDCDNPQPPPPTIAPPEELSEGKSCGLQNLHYTYDPAGNITHIRDDAQQTIYFRNQRVEPSAEYTYDAIYRLIEATGREHLGQAGGVPIPHSHDDARRTGIWNPGPGNGFHPGDGNAMGRYCEKYIYDAVGNIMEMSHHRSCPDIPSWTRTYDYSETSLLENGTGGTLLKRSNRLSSTTVGSNNPLVERYVYDTHGNMTRMPHLGGAHPDPNMHWDFRDQLSQADLGGGGTAYYVYDAAGQRVRKVWEKSAYLIEERIYLGGFEIFRRRNGAGALWLERETLHIMDDKQRIALIETRTFDMAGNDPAPQQLTRYQFGNHLGSASLELDDQAQIISYEEYTPYGSTSYQAVRSQTETPKRYRYTGKERDEEIGLYYHGVRYYAPWLGRWMTYDPIGVNDGLNPYAYVRNNPTLFSDPNGTDSRRHDAEEDKSRIHTIHHVSHITHEVHLAAEGVEFTSHQISQASKYAKEYTQARELLKAHSEMSYKLKKMRRKIKALENLINKSGRASAVGKLERARKAFEVAKKAFESERGLLRAANEFVKAHRAVMGSSLLSKAKATFNLGKAARVLQSALESSRIGRGLLATGRVVSSKAFGGAVIAVGALVEAVGGYLESPAQTTTGKITNAVLAGGGGALVMANPWVAGADLIAPKGYKLSEVYRGTASSLTSIGEGFVTGDTSAMEEFHTRSKAGEYGKATKAASEAGDFWAEKGIVGGLREFGRELWSLF
ncbi:MAG: RHS repeat-associated core domain-containing protein [Anaerolineae bacterium]|nr:RHS repeat-associated core domain-containing protein [Anaerolineae bacterium]